MTNNDTNNINNDITNTNTNIDHAFNHIHRKLTKTAQLQLQFAFANEPGIPPVEQRIARKEPQLLTALQDDLWAGVVPPYARYKADWQSIAAILPTYLHDGANGTVVYYTDGSYDVLHNRIIWVLDDLLEHMLTSKRILEHQSIRWMGGIHRRRVPLVVNTTFTLVPVTCRLPERRNDGATGYVVLQHIQRVLPVSRWHSLHRDEEDLLQDYDTVLNHTELNPDDTGTVILLNPTAEQKPLRQCSKLIVRDTAITVQNNIYLAHQLLRYYETVQV